MSNPSKTYRLIADIIITNNQHPRKWIIDAITDCLNLDKGEDIIDYEIIETTFNSDSE